MPVARRTMPAQIPTPVFEKAGSSSVLYLAKITALKKIIYKLICLKKCAFDYIIPVRWWSPMPGSSWWKSRLGEGSTSCLVVIVALNERDDLIVSYWHGRQGFILHFRSGDVVWFSQSRGNAVIAVRPDCFSHRGSIASEILTSILSATAVRYVCDLYLDQMTIQGIIVPTFINYSNRYYPISWFYQRFKATKITVKVN